MYRDLWRIDIVGQAFCQRLTNTAMAMELSKARKIAI